MKRFLTCSLTAALLSTTASAGSYNSHHVIVLEDSGVAQDMTTDYQNDGKNRPMLRTARLALLDRLDAELGRRDLVTVISVAVPQVVWQGSANDMLDKDNFILADFLAGQFNGCANYERVFDTVNREVTLAKLPLKQLVFMASLVSTGGNTRDPSTCQAPKLDDLAPPESFFDNLVTLHKTTGATLEFYWVWDEVDDVVADYFMNAGVPFRLKGEQQSIAELSQ